MSPVKASHTARERARAELTREITEEARRQLADTGATGLSLRAVARELGMVSSALYRYFPSRDDLLTALIIDAYNALGEAAETAAAPDAGGAPGEVSPRARWLAACHAIRDWALVRPHEYALIYGSPVPGYRAPQATIGPASRVPLAFARVLADAVAGGALRTGDGPALDGALSAQAGLLAAALVESGASDVPPDALVRAVIAWAQLYGMISFELFGQFVGSFEPVDALFDYAVAQLATFVGLERQAPEDRHGISALYRNFSICSSVASHNLFSSTFASRIFRSEASPAVSPDGTTICVTDTDGNSVKVISASTGRVTGTIGAGELPRQIVITANGKTATVADPDSNAVSVIGHRHADRC